MRDEQVSGAGSDPAIDREIARALAVDPSPDFVARVRVRIANEPPPRTWKFIWMPVGIGALVAATVLIAAVVDIRVKPDATGGTRIVGGADVRLEPNATGEGGTGATREAAVVPRDGHAGPPVRRALGGVEPRTHAVSGFSRTTKPAEPEVLISQDEAMALRRFLARASQSNIIVPDQVADLKPPGEIAIDPITIDPIEPPANGEGVRQ